MQACDSKRNVTPPYPCHIRAPDRPQENDLGFLRRNLRIPIECTSVMAFFQTLVFKYNRLFQVSPLAIPTWLAIGAALQTLSLFLLPSKISSLLPILYIGYRLVKTKVDSDGVFERTYTNVRLGRWTSELPEPDDLSKEKGIVIFVLAARFNQLVAPAFILFDVLADKLQSA